MLVPATMRLMGDANWWIPKWLDRILPTIDIEGEGSLPELDFDTSQSEPVDDSEPVLLGAR